MPNERNIIVSPAPFRAPRVVTVPEGLSVYQIVMRAGCGCPGVTVEIDGDPVPRARWHELPPAGAHVLIGVPVHGGGGKDPLRTLLTIAVVVAAVATGQLYGATIAGSLGVTSAAGVSTVTALTSAAVMTAGGMLVNAIAPIRAPELTGGAQSYADSPTYSLSGARNAANPFGAVPVVLGTHRVYPPYGAAPYTELLGNDEYLRMLFIWGYGPLVISDIKIGDTPIEQYSELAVETLSGESDDPDITLVPSSVTQVAVGVTLTQAGGAVVRSAPEGSDEINIDIVFPRGLCYFASDGSRSNYTVNVQVQYREIGAGSWTDISSSIDVPAQTVTLAGFGLATKTYGIYLSSNGYAFSALGTGAIGGCYLIGYATGSFGAGISHYDLSPSGVTGCNVTSSSGAIVSVSSGSIQTGSLFNVTDATTSALRVGMSWLVDRTKNYEVSLTRTTADTDDSRTLDDVVWTALRGVRNDPPVDFPEPLAMTAVRIKATDQLQGIIDSLNAVVSSVAPVWSGSPASWDGDPQPTQNPAALFRHVLMHAANARPRTAAQIDDDTLGAWYEFCETEGYKFNMVRDFKSSIWNVLADIAAAGRAAPTLTDGKWGVVMDTDDRPVVQHITPRNSWGFSSEKILYDRPHAFRVRFVNEDASYQQDERIVYDDGYTAENATRFEGIEFPGVTDPDLVWKFGRFQIAQARLRPETYSLYQDFEHLVARRGSKVRVSHDVPLWGSGWGRVKELVTTGSPADTITGVILDEKVVMETGLLYACRFRLADADNTSLVLSVNTVAGETDTLTLSSSVPIGDGPAVGDLAMFGEADRETVELLVKSIERAGEFTARLVLVDASPEVYDADTGTIPDFDTGITLPADITKIVPAAPSITNVESGTSALEVIGSAVRARILATVTPGASTVRLQTYRVRSRPSGTTPWSVVEFPSTTVTVTIPEVTEGVTYQLQAQAVSIYGVESAWSETVNETVIGQTEAPSDVTGFSCNIIDNMAFLAWDPVYDIDLSHYRIRWSVNPGTSSPGPTWAESVDLVARVGKPATSITVPALIGTYLIKAVDYQGNESDSAALVSTSLSQIYGLNFIASIVEPGSPPWVGTPDGADYDEELGGIVLIAGGEEEVSVDRTSSSYWIPTFGTWDGSKWDSETFDPESPDDYQYIVLTPESWSSGYLPKAMTLTFSLASIDIVIGTSEEGFVGLTVDSGESIDFSTYGEITFLQLGPVLDTSFSLTKIEFSEESPALSAVGYYTLDEVIDLGSVIAARISASLSILGADLLDDLYDIPDLYASGNLYGDLGGAYSAGVEVRTTADDPDGSPAATWGSWQSLIIGNYSARGFQFRLRLNGTPPGITPIVTDLTVQVDMEDRIVGFTANVPVEGASVAFSPAFYVTPQIGLMVVGGSEGDAYTITGLDETGFDIAFTNGGSPVERNITGIAKAYGYKET